MKLNEHDYAVIEQALREAINQGADYYKVSTYQGVLGKLRRPQADGSSAQDGIRRYDDTDMAGFV